MILASFAILAAVFLGSLHLLLRPSIPKEIIMAIADAATAIESAAQALTAASTELNTSAAAIATAIQQAGNTDALTQPLADLGTAVTAVQAAATAVKQAAGA